MAWPWKALGDYRPPVGIFVESPFCNWSQREKGWEWARFA